MKENNLSNQFNLEVIYETAMFEIFYFKNSQTSDQFHDLFTIKKAADAQPLALLTTLAMPLKNSCNPCSTFGIGLISSGFFEYKSGFIHARNILQDNFSHPEKMDLIIFDHGYDLPPFPGAKLKYFKNIDDEFILDQNFLPSPNSYNFNGFSGDWDNDGFPELFICDLSNDSHHFYTNNEGKNLTMADHRLPPIITQNVFKTLSGTKIKDTNGNLHMALGSAGCEQKTQNDIILINSGKGTFTNKKILHLPERRGGTDWAAIEMHALGDINILANYHDAETQNGIIDLYLQNDLGAFKHSNPNKPLYEEKNCWFPRIGLYQNNIVAIKGRGLNKHVPKELYVVLLKQEENGYVDRSEELLPLSGKEFIGFMQINNLNQKNDIIFMEHSGNYFYCRKK